MPPHIIKRKDAGGNYYLVDGRLIKTLKTPVKRHAEALLERYIKGKLKLNSDMTIGEYYDRWIETRKEPEVRKSAARDYRQHFRYILPEFRNVGFGSVTVGVLRDFRSNLRKRGLAIKTIRNIIGGSFRAMWSAAIVEDTGIVNSDPFRSLGWESIPQPPPEVFTIEQRNNILKWVYDHESFYYPFVRFQFETGCRPSESAALRWSDIDVSSGTISITKSRNLGVEDLPKTKLSARRIAVSDDLIQAVLALKLPWHQGTDHVFYNKMSGGPLDPNQWARGYWKRICDGAEVEYRKFYATRHTSITEAVKRGENLLAIAQYHGTSIAMIERNYCGPLHLTPPKIPQISNFSVVVPTGLENFTVAREKAGKDVSTLKIKRRA